MCVYNNIMCPVLSLYVYIFDNIIWQSKFVQTLSELCLIITHETCGHVFSCPCIPNHRQCIICATYCNCYIILCFFIIKLVCIVSIISIRMPSDVLHCWHTCYLCTMHNTWHCTKLASLKFKGHSHLQYIVRSLSLYSASEHTSYNNYMLCAHFSLT